MNLAKLQPQLVLVKCKCCSVFWAHKSEASDQLSDCLITIKVVLLILYVEFQHGLDS